MAEFIIRTGRLLERWTAVPGLPQIQRHLEEKSWTFGSTSRARIIQVHHSTNQPTEEQLISDCRCQRKPSDSCCFNTKKPWEKMVSNESKEKKKQEPVIDLKIVPWRLMKDVASDSQKYILLLACGKVLTSGSQLTNQSANQQISQG